VLGHVTTFFTAGHETSASALTWILFLIAQHPHVYADLLDELEGTLHGAAPRLEQLKHLSLLNRVINEGMRMFPPSMWLIRTSTAPFALGSYELPGGTHVVFSPAVTHYRPDIYAEPHRFLPGRWETISPSPYEYLPFGNGPRRCLGATFAMLELQMVVSIILQRYRLVVPDQTKVDRGGSILSVPKGGLPVRLYARGQHVPAGRVRGNIHDLVDLRD
jgi:cytochrome P450